LSGLFAAVEIIKPHAGGSEAKSHSICGAVALLSYDQLSDILLVVWHAVAFLRSLVDLGAVDKRYDVGILFQRS